MLQLLTNTNIPFMRYRRFAYVFSGAIILATIGWLVVKGPRYSVDFTGGTLLQIRLSQALPADQVRAALDQSGFRGVELQQITAQGQSEFLLRIGQAQATAQTDVYGQISQAITRTHPGVNVELRRTENVGPKVGSELRQKAIWAVLLSLGVILLYVGIRYEFKYAFGAVVALLHDVLVTLGVLCFLHREVSLTVLAALLTIAGYSVNDTIVVFDRIRERSKALRKEKHSRVMDIAVNETLSRTVITAFTVFLSALALFIWGGEVLRDFSLAMLVGVGFGTYSSVYVASALALDSWIAIDRRKGVQAE
jgi:preprotein translocase SecF subunit